MFDPVYGGTFAGTGRGTWLYSGESVVLMGIIRMPFAKLRKATDSGRILEFT